MILVSTIALLVSTVSATNIGRTRMEEGVTLFQSEFWINEGPSDPLDTIKAVFALRQSKEDLKNFEATLLDISNPKSTNYGKWLTSEEVRQKIAPPRENVDLVTKFLTQQGVQSISLSPYNDMVFASMQVSVAEEIFGTKFSRFRSVIDKRIVLSRITHPYSLPADVASVVSIVDDIMRFPSIRNPLLTLGNSMNISSGDSEFNSCGTSCAGFTTPDVLEKAYSYSRLSSSTAGNSMSVAEFQFQYYDQADITAFDSACGVTVTVDSTIGGNKEKICEAGGCVEALLDIEYIGAVAHPIPLTVYYQQEFSLLTWVNSILTMANPPLVHSVSYGNDEVQQTSAEYMETCNTQFMMAGSMGLSILFASGDQGVWGRTGVGKTYHPDFPAGSPYITAVGGTNFQTQSVIGAESAWDCGGGGFSDEFTQPSWQAEAVNGYLASAAAAGVLPDSSLFNAAGRGYPDVAALGGQTNPYCISYHAGTFAGVAGTSASAPVVAGIFAQLNDIRLAAGKSSLGWLNPLIYQNSQCFNDINDGSMNNCIKGTSGFAALSGWDPATGMGSPNFACLAAIV